MKNDKQGMEFFEIADKYINLANDIAKSEGTANTGTALRYAAARYNTFEASLSTQDLAGEKDKLIDMLCDDFREMLKANMDDYIQLIAKRTNQ
ncbi:DUF3144 domain-containing protein [Kaarinaea lacus]